MPPVPGEATSEEMSSPEAPQIRIARSEPIAELSDAEKLAASVTIYRDPWGVPHIHGSTDKSVIFGFAYAQAEDFFWQVEDNFILSLGRYAEIHGGRGLNSDLLNRAYRITQRSEREFAGFNRETRELCDAFAAGLNYYLKTHPDVEPRLIKHFEPWHVLAFHRQIALELCFRYTRLSDHHLPRENPHIWAAAGSNAWAVSGERTATGEVMLMANPHLPWFGMAQMYEAHLHSDEGLHITGATLFGSPIMSVGHNEHLGWTLTINEPDIADVWIEKFDHPSDPLLYRYGDEYRKARQWTDTIRIKSGGQITEKPYVFTETHHGPVVGREAHGTVLTAQISGLFDAVPFSQGFAMAKATNFEEFRAALGRLQMPMMNILYGDRAGNIFYLYGGKVPRRDPQFDWSKPVDGSDPRTEWQGVHAIDDLPQLLNPPSGYVQNCNSSPFTTTEDVNPLRADFPAYMAEDADDDKRRAKRSRQMLGEMKDVTFDEFQLAMFDTEVYWAKTELPKYKQALEKLRQTDPQAAQRVAPYLEVLLEWDGRIERDSVAATLCEAWYETIYGSEYPGESLKPQYAGDLAAQLEGLVTAAKRLRSVHGSWELPYGDIHRLQRQPYVADLLQIRFQDAQPSLPSTGGHGPMGVILTQYYTPSIYIPLVVSQRKRYGVVGATYLAAWAFGPDGVRGTSLINFGASGNPDSPHYFDQASLLSDEQLKPILFEWDEVLAKAVKAYHPGGAPLPVASGQ
ncbi:MAG: penicillin acylase family protein [Pirellulales bacterium]